MHAQLETPAQTGHLPSAPTQRAILVLGMHRGGTSALTGAINALGAALPKTLQDPDSFNPRGYFESAALKAAHDDLLASAGSHWHDWREFNAAWIHSEAAELHRETIRALLIEEFGDEPLIVLKDPRICRFVPFTASILKELKFRVVAILLVRNPLEVASSLQRRNEFALSESTRLWLRHMLDAEVHTRHMSRCFLQYEEFVSDPGNYLDRAGEKIGIRWPDPSDRSAVKIDPFVSADLRRERASFDELNGHPEVAPLVREGYRILTDLVSGGETQNLLDQLDLVRAKFDEDCQVNAGAIAAAYDSLVGERNALAAERDTLAVAYNTLLAEREALVPSYNSLVAECEALVPAYKSLLAERDALAPAYKSLLAERDALAPAYKSLIAKHDALVPAYKSVIAERDALVPAYKSLVAERDRLAAAYNSLRAERDRLEAAYESLLAEHEAYAASADKRRAGDDTSESGVKF